MFPCSIAQFYPTCWPSGGFVVHHWPRLQRVRSLAAFNVNLQILVLEIPFHRENSPVTQTTPEPTLLSWGGWPCEKNFPHPWPHGKPGLIALIGPLRPYCSPKPFDLAQVCHGNKICSKLIKCRQRSPPAPVVHDGLHAGPNFAWSTAPRLS